MKKKSWPIYLVVSTLLGITPSFAAQECSALNIPLIADDGTTVTLTSISVVEKTGSNQLTISYVLRNSTLDKKLDEGSFKIFFSNGESIPQYGGFGYLFPSDVKTRSHTWEYLKTQVPTVIEYNAGFFSSNPSASKLNWVAPGGSCLLGPSSPGPTKSDSAVNNIGGSTSTQAIQSTDAANEEVQAASDATDAALAAADAADAATTKAQEAVDAVANLSAEVSKWMAFLKAQISSLAELVTKVQKRLRT